MDGLCKGLVGLISAVVMFSALTQAWAAEAVNPIAGLKPHERPAEAPTIMEVQKDGGWYNNALQGLEPPHPSNFRFLEDQGNWHTPFNRPGMTGRYDIRAWHSESDVE